MPELVNDGCPFCIENGQLEVLSWYPRRCPIEKAEVLFVKDTVFPDVYLVITRVHLEDASLLPDDFTKHIKRMLAIFTNNADGLEIITTTNFGTPERRAAGTSVQTIAHLHTKVILVPEGISVLGLTSYHRLERELQEVMPGMSISTLIGRVINDAWMRDGLRELLARRF